MSARKWIALSLTCTMILAARPGWADDAKLPAREDYRYDRKTFAEWRTFMLTELKTENRVEALRAMRAFAIRGYAKEAAAPILQVVQDHLRDHDNDYYQHSENKDKVLQSARAALVIIAAESEPLLLAGLRSPDEKLHIFCLAYLGGYRGYSACSNPSPAALPFLMDMVQDKNPKISAFGLTLVGSRMSQDDSKFAQAFTEQMKKQPRAGDFLKALEKHLATDVRSTSVDLLQRLGPIAKPAVPALLQALAKSDSAEMVTALVKIGCEPDQLLPHLIRMVEKREGLRSDSYRDIVMGTLDKLGPKAKAAVPALLKLLPGDEDDRPVALQALAVVQKIGAEPKQVIPVLIGVMKERLEKNLTMNEELEYLLKLGPLAKDAVPGLVQLLKMTDAKMKKGSMPTYQLEKTVYEVVNGKSLGYRVRIPFDPRQQFVDVLGQIGPNARAALPILKDLREVPTLSKAISEAIAKIQPAK